MRDYDPTTGRYIQADPLGLVDGASVYGYALQNPGRYVDPRGEFTLGDAVQSLKNKGVKPTAKDSRGRSMYPPEQVFGEWLDLERSEMEWLERVPECACTTDEIDFTKWTPLTPANQYYHPGAVHSNRSIPRPLTSHHGGQCMYDKNGNLIMGPPGGGSADFFSPSSLIGALKHYNHDVVPFELAKSLGPSSVIDYFSVRPSK
jgi:hypothetical protein